MDYGVTDGTLTVWRSCLKNLHKISPHIELIRAIVERVTQLKEGIMACQGLKCLFIDGHFDISPEPIRHYFSELEGLRSGCSFQAT